MSEPIIEYRAEFNVMDFASKYAERVSRVIDEQTLANVEHQLAGYGYVKVVRCRDCRYYEPHGEPSKVHPDCRWCDLMANYLQPDGFCAYGERRNK